jgi:hypothetical protein
MKEIREEIKSSQHPCSSQNRLENIWEDSIKSARNSDSRGYSAGGSPRETWRENDAGVITGLRRRYGMLHVDGVLTNGRYEDRMMPPVLVDTGFLLVGGVQDSYLAAKLCCTPGQYP